jgi:hypothetical protein
MNASFSQCHCIQAIMLLFGRFAEMDMIEYDSGM